MARLKAVLLSLVLLILAMDSCARGPIECIGFNFDSPSPVPNGQVVSLKIAHALGTPGNFLPKGLGTPTAIYLARDPPRGRMVVFRYDLSSNRRIFLYEERASVTPAEFHAEVKASGHGIRVRDDREAVAFSGPNCQHSATETTVDWLEGRIRFLFRARNIGLDQSRHLIEEI